MRRALLRLVEADEGPRDADVIARVASGDIAALGVLYDRYAAMLLAFAQRAAPPGEAEDVVQATFLRVQRIAATFDGNAPSARPWLFAIAVRVIQGRRRSLHRLAAALRNLAHVPREAQVQRVSERRDLTHGLSQLSEEKRVVFMLSQLEGFTAEQIASMLSVPVGTVWTRLHHARRELRAYLGEE